MMSSAVTGPIPAIVSSSAAVAVAEADRAFFGAGSGRGRSARRRAGHAFRDDDLLAVRQPGGEVQRIELRLPGRPARPLDRFVDPAPFRQPVDPGLARPRR